MGFFCLCLFQFSAFFVAWIGVVFIVFRCLLCQMRITRFLCFYLQVVDFVAYTRCVCVRAWYFYSVLCKLCLTINSAAKAAGAALAAAATTAATILSVIIVMLESLSRLKIIFCYNHFLRFFVIFKCV